MEAPVYMSARLVSLPLTLLLPGFLPTPVARTNCPPSSSSGRESPGSAAPLNPRSSTLCTRQLQNKGSRSCPLSKN